MLNQGYIEDDYSYHYQCRQCSGWHGANSACSHCYGGDLDRLLVEFATARGERYYALLKRILVVQGQAICEAVYQIRDENGKLTPVDMAGILLAFGWPDNRLKPLAEWLEECGLIYTGTYDRLKSSGLKPSDVIRAARVVAGAE